MTDSVNKEELLSSARKHLSLACERITDEIRNVEGALERSQGGATDEIVRKKLLQHFTDRLDQLHHMQPSPYFVRCDVRSNDGEEKMLYFSKFSLFDQSIFSWMSAAARIRFSEIGSTSYPLPGGTTWNGQLTKKDQFMIVDGKIIFMASESGVYGRTLIHQEKLSQQKSGFMLPEIVERMEKAQDDVIRAPAQGSFLIAGPAGSGKTTLALHRLAYLLQSPDTASRFEGHDMVVFVQDQGTQQYFSRLLPDLGIHNVKIITFGEWAIERLRLTDYSFIRRPNGVDEVIDNYEEMKCRAMRSMSTATRRQKNIVATLADVYASSFSDEHREMFEEQIVQGQFDRFDLSILLKLALKNGPLTEDREYFVQKKNFEITRKLHSVPLKYSLIVIDEAQNYLAEQVTILRSCITEETKAMLYVGDLGQQVLLGTVRDWSHAGEAFSDDQKVKLEKVYRNTKSILLYLQTLGFIAPIPEGLREGMSVTDEACSAEEEIDRLKAVVAAGGPDTHIGILSPSSDYLETIRKTFEGQGNVHVLSIHEAQGVEFERVCLVGVSSEFFTSKNLTEERLRIKKDLIYVGLTRAMDELYIFGRTTLKELLG